jgi:hypothetical protein
MVRVTSLPIRQDDDARTKAAENASDLQPVLPGVLDVAVCEVKSLAVRDAQNACSLCCFAGAIFSRAASSGLTLRQVKNAGAPAECLLNEQRSAAGLFNIVAMRGDSKYVHRGLGTISSGHARRQLALLVSASM